MRVKKLTLEQIVARLDVCRIVSGWINDYIDEHDVGDKVEQAKFVKNLIDGYAKRFKEKKNITDDE